jgi:hypothetical protein
VREKRWELEEGNKSKEERSEKRAKFRRREERNLVREKWVCAEDR